jgi:hypothetical protein
MMLRKKKKTISTNLALSISYFRFLFRYGIDSALMPWVTFGEAPYGKSRAMQGAKPLDRG